MLKGQFIDLNLEGPTCMIVHLNSQLLHFTFSRIASMPKTTCNTLQQESVTYVESCFRSQRAAFVSF